MGNAHDGSIGDVEFADPAFNLRSRERDMPFVSNVSVTAMLQGLVDQQQQFCSVKNGWIEFLGYLRNRHGCDLKRADVLHANPLQLINTAYALLDAESEDEASASGVDSAALSDFGTDPVWVTAFLKFLREERGILIKSRN